MTTKYNAISVQISHFIALNQWYFNAQTENETGQLNEFGQHEIAITGVSEPLSIEAGSWRLTLQADSALAVILALTLLLQAMSKLVKAEQS